MPYRLRVLGPPELLSGGGRLVTLSLGKPMAVLVYVACSPGPVPRDELASALWPGSTREKGRHSVRQALWVLRSTIGENLFESEDPLSLKQGAITTDLERFTTALANGDVGEAQALWRGPVLEHFALAGVTQWSHWKEELRSDLELRFRLALIHRAEVLREQGDAEEALSVLETAIEVDSSAEAPHVARIELLLELLRLDAAREALADAYRSLGSDDLAMAGRLTALDERLNKTIHEQRSRVHEPESFPLEFVGRSRELARLQTLWRDARAGRTQTALITGPSGIGKTRMARELLAGFEGGEARTVTLKGTRAERKLRWGAAADFVRQLLRLPGSAGISAGSDSLLKAMLPSLGRDTINLQTVNGVSPAAILDAATDLLAGVTFEAPLVVLLDDFQWIDSESRTLFTGLARRVRDLPVLILVLGRSDLASRNWGEMEATLREEAGAERLPLSHLIREEVGELLALGAGFPNAADAERVVTRIHRASGGNPLFIREILKELHDRKVLLRDERGWVFHTADLPKTFTLPQNIRTLLTERLDRLSTHAAGLAAALAMEDRPTPVDVLRARTRLNSDSFPQAVAELLDRGVVEWVEGTSLDFVHDLLREAARNHLAGSLSEPPGGTWWHSHRRVSVFMAAILILATPIGILWGSGNLVGGRGSVPEQMPYGGGELILARPGGPLLRLEPEPGNPWEWTIVPSPPPLPPEARRVFRGQDEGLQMFGVQDLQDGPDIVKIRPDGSMVSLFPGPGDQTLYDLSPDGSRLLFVSQNPLARPFGHNLFWADTSGVERHLIFEGNSPVGSAVWSPAGDMVAFNITGSTDTVAVHALSGERLGALPLGDIGDVDWCGPSDLIVMTSSLAESELLRVAAPEMTVDTVATGFFGESLSCSPDGTAVVHLAVVEGRPRAVLRDLTTSQLIPLPIPPVDMGEPVPVWLDPSLEPSPVAVRAAVPSSVIEWGHTLALDAEVIYSDGSASREGIRWESLDPAIAAVNSAQELTGNRAGSTLVLARWGHSFIDTVKVEVQDYGSSGSALLREEFEQLDAGRWMELGWPKPRITMLDGESVLELMGDEKYTDGLVLLNSVPLDRGVTVELEFKFRLDASVWQSLSLCLADGDPRDANAQQGTFRNRGDAACVRYPARDLAKMDPQEISLNVSPGLGIRARVPGVLPPDDWTHMALQVRPDGQVTLVVDREPVATHLIHLPPEPKHQWTVILDADAVGTRVFVRSLNIWTEARYEVKGGEERPGDHG